MQDSLTDHLLSKSTANSYAAAVQHPFLHAARTQTLSPDLLSFWLAQDRIYAAHAYPRFIGALIAKIRFSARDALDSEREKRNKRVLKVLTFSLQNVVREVDFFLDTARKFGLDLEGWRERAQTKAYTAEMARVSSWGSLEEGLVFLWAMEKVYLDVWTFVAGGSGGESSDRVGNEHTIVNEFAQNWTNDDFIKFVDELREIVDDLEVERGSDLWERAEATWDRIIELETDFWPELGEERLSSSRT
ncbi:hypothetical protein M0805_008690 [Coniferiporia weirii]|nr:hypothetical protein M0805_008690 [Coniferiporia weirii]